MNFIKGGCAALLLLSVLAGALFAEDDTRIGAGVSVSNDTSLIRMTLDVQKDLRLEPYFGFTYTNPDVGPSTTDMRVGVALEGLAKINGSLSGYYGGFVDLQNNDNGITTTTDFNLGPVGGVEYAFDKRFTVGAELRLNFGFGDNTTVGTQSSVLVRYYFN